jgi:hypothetical protein
VPRSSGGGGAFFVRLERFGVSAAAAVAVLLSSRAASLSLSLVPSHRCLLRFSVGIERRERGEKVFGTEIHTRTARVQGLGLAVYDFSVRVKRFWSRLGSTVLRSCGFQGLWVRCREENVEPRLPGKGQPLLSFSFRQHTTC